MAEEEAVENITDFVEEIKEETIEEELQDSATKVPVRRGGYRSRARKKRGGRKSTPDQQATPPKVMKEEQPGPDSEIEKRQESPDEGEIEISQDKTDADIKECADETNDEEESGEGREPREPSPVVTRRSSRKVQLPKLETSEEETQANQATIDIKEEEQEVKDIKDQDEVESVTSELDSIASESTLTTRSRRRGGPGSQSSIPKGKKGSRVPKKSTNGPGVSNTNGNSGKGKSRRIIFKKSATRAPSAVARAVTSDRVYYRGQYFTRGDIVSVEDLDGSVYYAQLRGFLTDQYCEKSGVITWLLPTVNSPPPEDSFDPSTYVIGPEEDLPRKLDYFTFVMHAPDDYFYYRKAPYPTDSIQADQEYLITRQGPRVRMIKAGRPVFQDTIPPLIPLNS